ncbi:MAG: UDP-N-acetylmuramate--L-alanine ligase [Clostridiales bacterium]|nr:UDP-N-acetylmuramate--L-alanine ligase [Clostridiales bacterium]
MINLLEIKQVHCIGIGGIGLSAVAEILLSKGMTVTGSDMNESDITDRLIRAGAHVFLGHRAKNVDGADMVVFSAAVSQDNPELARAEKLQIPIVTRAEMLGALMEECKNSIAIAGTHGKTTTTSMISLILENAKKSPTILVGGNLGEIGGNVKVGGSDYFITEACEYMDSFLSLNPKIEIILNIDSDHLDYFKDIEHIVNSFSKFAKLVPPSGLVIAYDANPFVKSVIKDIPNAVTFGLSEGCSYYATNITFSASGMPRFSVESKGTRLCEVQLSVPGEHNVLNALASFSCCHELGIGISDIVRTLENFKGTQRRFDAVGITRNNVKIVDDYAHHPTEIRATLEAAQNVPHREIWCLFQPHTYTRTIALFDEFADAFESADKLLMAEIYAAREKNIYKISSRELVNEIKLKYPLKQAYYFNTFDEIADFVVKNAQSGDLVITMGAGDIYKVAEIILEKDWEI